MGPGLNSANAERQAGRTNYSTLVSGLIKPINHLRCIICGEDKWF